MPVVGNESLERLAALATQLAGLYASAEQRVQRAIAARVEKAMAISPDQLARALDLARLRGDAQAIVAELALGSVDQVEELFSVAMATGTRDALAQLPAALRTQTASVSGAAGIAAIADQLANATITARRSILRLPDDVFRRAVADPVAGLLAGAVGSSREAQAAAWQTLIAEGAQFTDRSGRRWNSASYVEMATRTATRRAYSAQQSATLTAVGVDLRRVVIGREACKECARWAGKVLRADSGPTGRVEIPSMLGPGTITVNIAGTIDEAESSGWHHPNCRCTTVAYIPGAPRPPEMLTTYDPAAEQARGRLRALERRVRQWKTKEAAAVTPEQRAAARARIREAQAAIREHVEANPTVTRQRNREQVNLGNG